MSLGLIYFVETKLTCLTFCNLMIRRKKLLIIKQLPYPNSLTIPQEILLFKGTMYRISHEYCIDVILYHLFQMKNSVGCNYKFRLLFNVAQLVMVAPHLNAGIERVYALVSKYKSEGSDRNRLDIEGTLSSIKLNQPEVFSKCYELTLDVKLMSETKKQQQSAITCIHHHHHHHQNFRLVVVFCKNVNTFSLIDNTRCYCSLLRLFIFTFSVSGFSSIYLPLLVKPVLWVFLECFKCEIKEILRRLRISTEIPVFQKLHF